MRMWTAVSPPQAGYITSSLAEDTHTHDARCEFTRARAHCDILDSIGGNTSFFEHIRCVEVNLPREEIQEDIKTTSLKEPQVFTAD